MHVDMKKPQYYYLYFEKVDNPGGYLQDAMEAETTSGYTAQVELTESSVRLRAYKGSRLLHSSLATPVSLTTPVSLATPVEPAKPDQLAKPF